MATDSVENARLAEDEELIEVTPAVPKDEPSVDEHGNRIKIGIDGVQLHRLGPQHVDHRGSLLEVVDFRLPFWDEPIIYAYRITIRPGRIKGWGMHKLQTDRYFVSYGLLRVVLYDGRPTSPTYERFSEFQFSNESPGLLKIPPGVWHADQNVGRQDVLIINYPTRIYDKENPDKYRIDVNSGLIPFDWTLKDY
jgi:dTDP-4-dehydrorhamnose 3,5-epimerase